MPPRRGGRRLTVTPPPSPCVTVLRAGRRRGQKAPEESRVTAFAGKLRRVTRPPGEVCQLLRLPRLTLYGEPQPSPARTKRSHPVLICPLVFLSASLSHALPIPLTAKCPLKWACPKPQTHGFRHGRSRVLAAGGSAVWRLLLLRAAPPPPQSRSSSSAERQPPPCAI